MMYVRRRSPLARLFALGVTVALLAVVGTRIKGALNNANRVQAQANHLSTLAEGGAGASLLIAANLRRELAGVRARIGARAPMIEVQVGSTGVEFQYVEGQRAAGFTANTVQPALVPEQVTLVGDGSPRSQSFPLSIVRAAVPGQLRAAIRRRPGLSDFTLESATLAKEPVAHHLVWTVAGTGGGHELVFEARPNGRGLHKIG